LAKYFSNCNTGNIAEAVLGETCRKYTPPRGLLTNH